MLDEEASKWLAGKLPGQWTKSHFHTFTKNDMFLNNLCESFNNLILDAKDKPIIIMLEIIGCILVNIIHANKTKMQKNEGPLCPKIQQIIE